MRARLAKVNVAAKVIAVAGCALPAATNAQNYTVAFSSFRPANTDIFIARGDGSDPQPFSANRALDYNASISPDGNWVVFTSERDGSADIFRAHLDGSELERLIDNRAFDDQAVLSPDGASLAFVSSRSDQADIWIQDLDSGRARNVTAAPSGEFRPSWSPDGQWLAFSSDRDPPRKSCVGLTGPTGPGPFITPQYSAVFIVRPDGSGLRQLSAATEVAGSPAWSADGKKVVFHSAAPEEVCTGGFMFANGTSQIASVDVATGARALLTEGAGLKISPHEAGGAMAYVSRDAVQIAGKRVEGDFGRPSWSRDGRTMVFHRERASHRDPGFVVMEQPSLDRRFGLLALPGHSAYSPRGDRFAYLRLDFSQGAPSGGVLVTANADGTDPKVLHSSAPGEVLTGPAWSPAGDAIVFGSGAYFRRAETEKARLMMISPDGAGLKSLSDGTTNDGLPSWSPDGSDIIFRVASGPTRGLYLLNVSTGARRRLETGSDRDTFPSWSPRGDWITFTSQRDGDYEIYRIRPDGSGVQRLTRLPGTDAHSHFSPDGEWIAFATSQQGFKDEAIGLVLGARPPQFQGYGEIAVMRADGSDMHVLTDNSIEDGVPVWTPRR